MSSPCSRPPSEGSALKPSTSSPDDYDNGDLMSDPSRTEILRLENELKVKDTELTKVLSESRALRQTNLSMATAVASLSEEIARLKEKIVLAEEAVDSKTLGLREANEQRKNALLDHAAAAAAIRRLQASKDNIDSNVAQGRPLLEAELRLAQREIVRLQEEAKVQDKQLKAKEQALLEAERDISKTLERASRVDELENKLVQLGKQLEASQEENRALDRLYKMKVDELRRHAEKIDKLQEELLAAAAVQSVIKGYERQLQEYQVNQKVLNEELARAKVVASRVASALANEYKDDNDKVVSVRQWLDEKRVFQSEISKLKDKLAAAEKATKYEIQMKMKAQARLKVIEESLKASGPRRDTVQPQLPDSGSHDTAEVIRTVDGESSSQACQDDSVPAVLYDTLQREVVSLRKAAQEKDHLLHDKETSLDMLTKKVELLMRAMDIDSRKYRREITQLREEVSTLKVELQARGPRRSTRVSKQHTETTS